MRRSPSSRPTVRWLAALAVGVLSAAVGAVALPHPAPAEEVVDPWSRTTVTVAPGDRTAPGTVITVTAEVDDAAGDPVVGEDVRFWVDGQEVAVVALDGDGRAATTVVPPQGAHLLGAVYRGRPDLVGSSDEVRHSVLPTRCADHAHPDGGAVVRHAYLVALRRCPDPAGYAYWLDRLETGSTPGAVAGGLARTPEAIAVVVDDAYERILGRPADPAGRAVWLAKLRAGWATSQLWAALAASPEMVRPAGADIESLVVRVFERIVGRPIDPDARSYWRDRLLAGGGVHSPTWRALAVAAEVVDGIVVDGYAAALGRAPTADEALAARASIRTRRGDWRPLRAELLARPEASTHAQRYPDPVGGA